MSLFLLFFLSAVLAGCSGEGLKNETANKLQWLDQKLGQGLGGTEEPSAATSTPEDRESDELQASELNQEQKEKIDQWLEDNNLNRYGDSAEAIYPDGTPLYNKETGERIARFEYILDRYPDILERINNSGQ
ncbi:MAG TPA: hypothetical protein VKO42_04215 [Patescibacteria group bacterium]|nr:hypothetical protein [Patescibacteria group bacterium]